MSSINHLRILIALAVLKNTPEDQTSSTYISSLKDAFPSLSFKTHDNFWENHARRLEKECVELKATLENLQIRSFLDANGDLTVKSTQQTDVSALTSSLDSSVPVPAATGKKKSKKKSESNGGEIVEEDSLADILKQGKTKFGTGNTLHPGMTFQSLDIFLQLWIRHSLPRFPRPAFLIATQEVFKALAESFKEATKQRTNLKFMRMLQVALCSVIDKAVPLVASWLIDDDEALSSLFEHLLDMFNTIIPSFMSVSEHNLAYLRSVESPASSAAATSSSVADYTDGRVSILALFQSALIRAWSSLSSSINRDGDAADLGALACADFSVMVHTLILSSIRHLQEILRDSDGQHIARTRFQRIKRLAVKDAFWYLCSVTHFLLGVQDRTPIAIFSKPGEDIDSEPRQKSLLRLLRQTIIVVMEDLVIYQDRIRAAVYAASYGRVSKTSSLPAIQDDGSHDPESAPSSQSASQPDYVILDDLEYRMLLRLVERFLGMPLMP